MKSFNRELSMYLDRLYPSLRQEFMSQLLQSGT